VLADTILPSSRHGLYANLITSNTRRLKSEVIKEISILSTDFAV